MPIRDVLWTCPACRGDARLRPAGRRAERCDTCGARFRRGSGADIVATFPDGTEIRRPAPEWMDELRQAPEISPSAGAAVATAEVSLRDVIGYDMLRGAGGELLNRIERLAEPKAGTITLYADRLTFHVNERTREWPLLEISALGSASGSLQLRRRSEVLMIRFRDASVRWWEERLRAALRDAYAAARRGNILEFQPRIRTR